MSFTKKDLEELQKSNEKFLCELSFYYFCRKAYEHAFQHKMIDGIHVAGLAYHLQALYEDQMKLLIGNLPPGIGKSSFACVLFPAWIWAKSPNWGMWFNSYGMSLIVRDSLATRDLIKSDWYQSHWGDKFKIQDDQNQKLLYYNTSRGWRMSTTVRSNSGFGYHPVLFGIDDPLAPKQAVSPVERQLVIDEWKNKVSTRGIVVGVRRFVIAQRLHENDLCGYLLENEKEYVHFMMPMEFEPDRKCKTNIVYHDIDDIDEMGNPRVKHGWEDPRTEPGELLWPQGMDAKKVSQLKMNLGSAHTIAGQLQQRPSAQDGDMFEKKWFERVSDRPKYGSAIRAWDKASSTDKKSDFTAGVIGVDDGETIWLLNCKHFKKARKERDELIASTCISDMMEWANYEVALEQEGGSGGKDAAEVSADELYQKGIPVKTYRPLGKPKKYADGGWDSGGWEIYVKLLSEGRVKIVDGDWVDGFIEEHLAAPFGNHDDRIDAAARVVTELFKRRRKRTITRDLLTISESDIMEIEKEAEKSGKKLCPECGGFGCERCEFKGLLTRLDESLPSRPEFDELGVVW